MALWNEIREIFRGDVSLSELTDPSRAGARVREFLLLMREIARSIRQDDAFTLASALAFKTLLALVPTLAICLAVVAMLDPSERTAAPTAQVTPGAETPVTATNPATTTGKTKPADQVSYTDNFIRVIKDRIPDFEGRDHLIDSIQGFAANAGAIAGIGFVVLFGTALSLLLSMETAFNAIWQVKEQRAFLSRLTAFLATLVIVPVLMSFSVYLTTGVTRLAGDLESKIQSLQGRDDGSRTETGVDGAAGVTLDADDTGSRSAAVGAPTATDGSLERSTSTLEEKEEISLLKRVLIGLSSLIMTCLAMTALFYLLPYTVVRVRAALAGGMLSGFLFEAAMYLFHVYANYLSGNYMKIYGPLLAIPLFLLWVWLVWVIVLLGAEVAFTTQNFRDLAVRAELEKRGISSRVYLAVRTVLAAGVFFHRGENPTGLVDRVAEELQVPPYMIREVISVLVAKNILRRVVPAGEDAYLPAKDITALSIGDVIRAVSADSLDVPEAPDDLLRQRLAEMFGQVLKDSSRVLDTSSIADLVAIEYKSRLDAETRQISSRI